MGFPQVAPQIQIMARVAHHNVEEGTFFYKGNALAQWGKGITLVQVLSTIQQEFNQQPPIPVAASAGGAGMPQGNRPNAAGGAQQQK